MHNRPVIEAPCRYGTVNPGSNPHKRIYKFTIPTIFMLFIFSYILLWKYVSFLFQVAKGDAPQQPICILNIVLPDNIIPEPLTPDHDGTRTSTIGNIINILFFIATLNISSIHAK